MKRGVMLVLFTWVLADAQAQISGVVTSYLGAAGTSRNKHDAFSYVYNPASLQEVSRTEAAVYSEKPYMVKGLSLTTAAFAFRLKTQGIGVSLFHSGNSGYADTQIGLATAQKLGPAVSIGVQFSFSRVSQAGAGGKNGVDCTPALTFVLTDNLRITTCIRNLFSAQPDDLETRVYAITAGFQVGNYLYLWADFRKSSLLPAGFISGLHYVFNEFFYIKGGVSLIPAESWLATGICLRDYTIQISVRNHQLLGITPGLMLATSFGRKKSEG